MLLISDSSPSGIHQSLFSSTEAALPKPLPKYYQLGTKFKCLRQWETFLLQTTTDLYKENCETMKKIQEDMEDANTSNAYAEEGLLL